MSETDRSAECAEYVLGTLAVDERASLERALETDAGLRALVAQWEDWLVGLSDAIPEIAPSAAVWAAIERRIQPAAPPLTLVPDAGPAPVAEPTRVPPPIPTAPRADLAATLRRSRARWRAATLAFGAMAAGLALWIVRDRAQAPAGSYLAVVNRGGELPALIVRVDTRTETVSVRTLSAETPPGRVLELWWIAGNQPPRALGLLNRPDTRAALPPRSGELAGAVLAVSVEPEGGSPTGAPTGPVIYSGQLIRDE